MLRAIFLLSNHNDPDNQSDNAVVTAYLDTNIFLNVIYKEKQFEKASSKLLRSIQDGRVSGFTSAVTALEVILDINSSGFGEEISEAAISTLEDIRTLVIVPLDLETCKDAAKHVLKDKLTIHDSYHLATALSCRASYFVTRDEALSKKIRQYVKTVAPEELRLKE